MNTGLPPLIREECRRRSLGALERGGGVPPPLSMRPGGALAPAKQGGGGGGLGTCDIRNGELWCEEDLTPIVKYHCKMWYKMPGSWHNQKHRLRTVVAISYGPLGGSGCFLEASRRLLGWWLLLPGGFRMLVVGHKGNVHAKSARKLIPRKPASDLQIPRHNLIHFCGAKFSSSQFACSYPPPPRHFTCTPWASANKQGPTQPSAAPPVRAQARGPWRRLVATPVRPKPTASRNGDNSARCPVAVETSAMRACGGGIDAAGDDGAHRAGRRDRALDNGTRAQTPASLALKSLVGPIRGCGGGRAVLKREKKTRKDALCFMAMRHSLL